MTAYKLYLLSNFLISKRCKKIFLKCIARPSKQRESNLLPFVNLYYNNLLVISSCYLFIISQRCCITGKILFIILLHLNDGHIIANLKFLFHLLNVTMFLTDFASHSFWCHTVFSIKQRRGRFPLLAFIDAIL